MINNQFQIKYDWGLNENQIKFSNITSIITYLNLLNVSISEVNNNISVYIFNNNNEDIYSLNIIDINNDFTYNLDVLSAFENTTINYIANEEVNMFISYYNSNSQTFISKKTQIFWVFHLVKL